MVFDEIQQVPMRFVEYKKVNVGTGLISSNGHGYSWTSNLIDLDENPGFSLGISIGIKNNILSVLPKKMRASLKVFAKNQEYDGFSVRQNLNLTDTSQFIYPIIMEPDGSYSTLIRQEPLTQWQLKKEMEGILGEDFPYSTAMLELLERASYSGESDSKRALFNEDRAHAMKRLEKYVLEKDTEGGILRFPPREPQQHRRAAYQI